MAVLRPRLARSTGPCTTTQNTPAYAPRLSAHWQVQINQALEKAQKLQDEIQAVTMELLEATKKKNSGVKADEEHYHLLEENTTAGQIQDH